MNLALLDGMAELPEFQHTIGYPLWRLGQLDRTWRSVRELADILILPALRPQLKSHWQAEALVQWRLLGPLAEFGLVEKRATGAAGSIEQRDDYRTTPLFDRFLTFRI